MTIRDYIFVILTALAGIVVMVLLAVAIGPAQMSPKGVIPSVTPAPASGGPRC